MVYGNLSAVRIQNKDIMNVSVSNYQLIVSEDISLNGRLFVSGNVGIGISANDTAYKLDIVSASDKAPLNVKVGTTNALLISSTGKVAINSSTGYSWPWPLTILANTNETTGGNLICNSTSSSGGMAEFQSRAPFTIWDNGYNSPSGVGLKMGIWRDTGSAYIQCEGGNTGAKNICLQTYDGKVGIGITNPSYLLDVGGIMRCRSLYCDEHALIAASGAGNFFNNWLNSIMYLPLGFYFFFLCPSSFLDYI